MTKAWLPPAAAAAVLSKAPESAAVRLLGALLQGRDGVLLRIVEVEAYGGPGEDPASHAFRGATARNAPMFGAVGHLYAYLSYGIHTCLNVVVHGDDEVGAVLLRAAEVVGGADTAHRERAHLSRESWAKGPGRLGTASGYGVADSGLELVHAGLLRIPAVPGSGIRSGPRVGISSAQERPWRFWLPTSSAVSRPR